MSKSMIMLQISDMNIMRNLLMNLNISIIYIYGKNFARTLKYSEFTDEEIAQKYSSNKSVDHFQINKIDDIKTSNLYNRNLYKDIKGIGMTTNNLQFSRLFYYNYSDKYDYQTYTVENAQEIISFMEAMNNRYKLMSLIDNQILNSTSPHNMVMSYSDNKKIDVDDKDDILITHTVCIYHSYDSYGKDTLRVAIYLGVDENHATYKNRINDSLGIRDIYQISDMNVANKEIKLYKILKNFRDKPNQDILHKYSDEETFQLSSSYFNTNDTKELHTQLLNGLDSNMSRNDIYYYMSTFFNIMYILRKYIVLDNKEEDILTPFRTNELVFPVINIPKI